MAKQSKRQKETVERVMHEFKHGELETSTGKTVENPKQAIAIGLREAGASNQETPEKNKENFRKTREREGDGGPSESKADLYAQARRLDIPGRSYMTKAELKRAIRR